jgi:sec-independent protein translocase protein TatC
MPSVRRLLRRRSLNPEARMSVLDHLRELRRRLILMVLFVAAGAVVGWILYEPVLHFLEHPYCSVPASRRYNGSSGRSCDLIYTGVLDGFTTRLKVSFIAGAVFSAPLWLYQIWAFITPGLRRNERKYTVVFILVSSVLFAAGMTLAYVVLSKGLNVLIGSAGSGTQALLTVNSYLSFVTLMLLVFGAAFEVPLIVVLANLAGVLTAKMLRRTQRLSIFLIFVFAAVATPSTDPFTMCAMAVPMVLLFEIAVQVAAVHDRRKARREAEERAEPHLDDAVPSSIDPIPRSLDWSDST